MRNLAPVIAIYSVVMLVIHVSTGRILRAWAERPDGWVSRQLPPKRLLRVEALYWALALVAWPLWHPLAWKAVVAVFAAIHFAIWLGGELTTSWSDPSALTRTAPRRRAVVVFDGVEALVLVGVAVLAVLRVAHGV